ncbi:cyclase family protein [Selenihalanaerobacter shriftii]|uniref:Putative cyclase n=1 Tax=Selenihalanaerobacter shriftii TaxID=142842 RepID=A0A1T4LL23_9FIRM|nr:cyclase family protein [Selenihalanaerobacter shriftii]SJZ55341.1 Putative cyclase [Selenihalanaerobacter shriftii]
MKVIDLTKSIHTKMQVYPGDPEVSVEVVHTYEENDWLLRKLTMGSHTGTHVDAFSHMDKEGETLDDIPLNRFCGKAQAVAIDFN